jgi:3-hydroxyisobutyrate dehydrogenase
MPPGVNQETKEYKPMAKYTVAVLGLGAMGLPMARVLSGALTVRAFDVARSRLELAEQAGIPTRASARDAVEEADAVLVAVRDMAQLEDILFGAAGIASALSAGAVLILTSTVGIDGIATVADRLSTVGVELVDAPISGGPVRAGNGDLLVVVGASPGARERAWPALELLASTLTVIGDKPGDGQAFKTVNQLLCGIHIAAAAEALALARSLGLDPQATLETLAAGAAGSFMLSNRGPRMLQAYDDEPPEVLSRLDIFVKDMGIVTGTAKPLGVPTPLAAAAEQLYLFGAAAGLGSSDDSAIIRAIAPNSSGANTTKV